MKVKLVNLTPHAITIDNEHGVVIIPSHGLARQIETKIEAPRLDTEQGEIPVQYVSRSLPAGLPPAEQGVYYIVSSILAQSVPERTDLLVPGDSPAATHRYQDGPQKGQIRAVTGLYQLVLL